MKVFHTFFCFLFIALQGGHAGLFNGDGGINTEMEGEDITIECPFSWSGHRKFFCKKKCEKRNILIETTENTAENGRYSVEYEDNGFGSNDILHVTIKQLKKSDSGWYRCALERRKRPDSSWDFKIVVTGASTTSQPKSTLPTFPPSTFLPSTSTATTPAEQSLSSTSGRSEPPSTSTPTTPAEQSLSSTSGRSEPPSTSTEDTRNKGSPSDLHIYMVLILVVKIFIFSMPLMIFCKKRRSTKPKVPPAETNYAEVTESSRVIEEIMEDRRINSPPVESSSIYSNAKYIKPNGAENTDDYSFISFPPSKAKDDSGELDYTEVDFSNVAASSLSSAPCGDGDNVLYSSLQMNVKSANIREASAPLYSTVALHQ